MNQILKDSQTTGASFRVRTGNPTYTGSQDISAVHHIILVDYQSGASWTLQAEAPDGTWIDTDIEFNNDGIKSFHATPELSYRLTGGVVGASAWSSGVWRVEEP